MLACLNWDIDPVFCDLGVIELRYYTCLFAIGILGGYWFVLKLYKSEGINENAVYALAIYAILGIVIGARLGHCLFYDWAYFSRHPLEMILPVRFTPRFEFVGYRGLASHGGTIGVLIALYLYSRRYKMNYFEVLDKVAIVAPLTGAFIRFGNFVNSEIIGKATTTSPFAVVFRRVDTLPRHPSQLYEALSYLLVFIVLWFLYKRTKGKTGNGFYMGIAVALIFSARFLIEFTKENQVGFENDLILNMGQLLSIPFVILGIVIAVWKRKRK